MRRSRGGTGQIASLTFSKPPLDTLRDRARQSRCVCGVDDVVARFQRTCVTLSAWQYWSRLACRTETRVVSRVALAAGDLRIAGRGSGRRCHAPVARSLGDRRQAHQGAYPGVAPEAARPPVRDRPASAGERGHRPDRTLVALAAGLERDSADTWPAGIDSAVVNRLSARHAGASTGLHHGGIAHGHVDLPLHTVNPA